MGVVAVLVRSTINDLIHFETTETMPLDPTQKLVLSRKFITAS